ncbi:phosphodiester glycosidase family protein [Proteiniphilum saccharofermentans]|uniref:phosphodiester glycosidase family protein n=1 Tax=Proteiniphilum saccharofermentans TaxID=1642647 RepID=UPI0028A77274|nr:phosphodiester glycosidase family protein [Proteiniphilum saccharofermentans]
MKNIRLFTLILVIGALLSSCNDRVDYNDRYEAIPKTPVGKKLVDDTDLIAHIHSDTTYKVTEGVQATEMAYTSMEGFAMKIFIFEVDLNESSVDMKVSMPNGTNTYAMQPMTEQATFMDREGHKVWAGFNADFYNMSTGVPRGPVHREGVAVKTNFDSGDRGVFVLTDKKKALVATSSEYPMVRQVLNLQEAVGGGASLLRDGNILSQTDQSVEPRTCVGISADSTQVYVLAVDGRNFSYSTGMRLEELAEVLSALGASTGINLDGGGSTTFFVRNTPDFSENRFTIRNWPTDNGGKERAVANGVVIISKN